jgi:hypothetical protein
MFHFAPRIGLCGMYTTFLIDRGKREVPIVAIGVRDRNRLLGDLAVRPGRR